jgi:hypothetical protein
MTREEHKSSQRRAIQQAIESLQGDNVFVNLDCTVLGLNRLPYDVQRLLIEAIGDVQDAWLPRIGAEAVAVLDKMLVRLERNP